MNFTVYVPDQLWAMFRRAYPGADCEMAFRQWMRDMVTDAHERKVERHVISDLVRNRR